MPEFKGKWKYQSFRPNPSSISTDPNSSTFIPWSPPGTVTVNEDGTTGKLKFKGLEVEIDLKIHVVDEGFDRLWVSAVMQLSEGKQFTNELQGWFVPKNHEQEVGKDNPLVIRGSIVQTSADFGPKKSENQGIYTTGYFVLEPLA